MAKPGYVYILASRRNGTLYVGVTSDLIKRVHQHREGVVEGFSSKYAIHQLVYYETFDQIEEAIKREKALKKWRRKWKMELIEADNHEWADLYPTLTGFSRTREREDTGNK